MPLTRLTCPHCEQEVEINVTDVTRSRDCPRCGKYIILQFTTKARRMKRKALLLPTAVVGESAAAVGVRPTVVARPQSTSVVTGRDTPRPSPASTSISGSTPVPSRPRPEAASVAVPGPVVGAPALTPGAVQMLEGSPGERLLLDPDIKRKSSTLVWGIVVVVSLIALVIAADRFQWWSVVGDGFTRVMTFLSPPEPEHIGKANPVSVDPELPTAKEVLNNAVPAMPEMRPPQEVDSPSEPTTTNMSEQEKAMRAVQAFLQASSLNERLKLVTDPKLMADKMAKYYQTHDPGPIAFQKIVARETSPMGVLSFAFSVVLASGEERRVVVSRSFRGEYGVDWASFVAYGDLPWKEFMEIRPGTPTLMRVWAEPGDYYNQAFPKTANLVCLKLTDPHAKDSPPIYAYAQSGTPLAMALQFILRKSAGQRQPVIITLKYPQNASGAEPNQVLVEELIAEGWLARGR